MPRTLKVYAAPLGFFESVVAAPSKAAALRAWGVHQDLFASGEAKLATDPAAVKAATADPGVPLKRAIGGNGRFERDPDLPHAPAAEPGKRGARPKPKPDRAALDAAEARLKEIEDEQADGEAEFERRREALEAEAAAAVEGWTAAREKADADVERKRRAFVRAGGSPEGRR
jgi:hypothetical protein